MQQYPQADAEAALLSIQCTLPSLVAPDAGVRAASSAAKTELKAMWSRAYSRADVYQALTWAAAAPLTLDAAQTKLCDQTMGAFRRNGAPPPSPFSTCSTQNDSRTYPQFCSSPPVVQRVCKGSGGVPSLPLNLTDLNLNLGCWPTRDASV